MIFKTKKYTLDFSEKATIMAVINLTPDSFYEGSRYNSDAAVTYAYSAQERGAAIIDLGAQSTAPGNAPITAEEELERLIPALKAIRSKVDTPISVDTYFPKVAQAALENGADIINDVSGKATDEMADIIARHEAGWIIMHTGGLSSNDNRKTKTDIIGEINSFFTFALDTAMRHHIPKNNICFDPGIGFGKSREDDLEIIAKFSQLKTSDCATLAALSRKRVTKLCGDALTGTIVSNAACILGGANIIRVHDIEQGIAAAEMIKLLTEAKHG